MKSGTEPHKLDSSKARSCEGPRPSPAPCSDQDQAGAGCSEPSLPTSLGGRSWEELCQPRGEQWSCWSTRGHKRAPRCVQDAPMGRRHPWEQGACSVWSAWQQFSHFPSDLSIPRELAALGADLVCGAPSKAVSPRLPLKSHQVPDQIQQRVGGAEHHFPHGIVLLLGSCARVDADHEDDPGGHRHEGCPKVVGDGDHPHLPAGPRVHGGQPRHEAAPEKIVVSICPQSCTRCTRWAKSSTCQKFPLIFFFFNGCTGASQGSCMFRCLHGGSPGDLAPRAGLWQPGGCCKGQDRATGPFSRSGHAFCLH